MRSPVPTYARGLLNGTEMGYGWKEYRDAVPEIGYEIGIGSTWYCDTQIGYDGKGYCDKEIGYDDTGTEIRGNGSRGGGAGGGGGGGEREEAAGGGEGAGASTP
eukprot:1047938-Rhodomonas_salina.1